LLINRIITALFLLPLTIYAILYLELAAFTLVLSFIFILAANEWANITKLSSIYRIIFVALIILSGGMTWLNLSHQLIENLPIIACLIWLFFFYLVITFPKSQLKRSSVINIVIGLFVLLPSWLAMVLIKKLDVFQVGAIDINGGVAVLLLMCIVWIADTGAYFSGRKWGNKKLLPLVSPGKTMAGAYGAIVLTLLCFTMTYLIYSQNYYILMISLVLISALVIVSILGDLFESMFKRMNDVKDSGRLLPGHGGILDRIDSLTATAPFFYLALLILEKL